MWNASKTGSFIGFQWPWGFKLLPINSTLGAKRVLLQAGDWTISYHFNISFIIYRVLQPNPEMEKPIWISYIGWTSPQKSYEQILWYVLVLQLLKTRRCRVDWQTSPLRNRVGGMSNSGEGGEDPLRYKPLQDLGKWSDDPWSSQCLLKQVAQVPSCEHGREIAQFHGHLNRKINENHGIPWAVLTHGLVELLEGIAGRGWGRAFCILPAFAGSEAQLMQGVGDEVCFAGGNFLCVGNAGHAGLFDTFCMNPIYTLW